MFRAVRSNHFHCHSSCGDHILLPLWKRRANFLASNWVHGKCGACVSPETSRHGVGGHSKKPGILSKTLDPSGSPHQGRSRYPLFTRERTHDKCKYPERGDDSIKSYHPQFQSTNSLRSNDTTGKPLDEPITNVGKKGRRERFPDAKYLPFSWTTGRHSREQ